MAHVALSVTRPAGSPFLRFIRSLVMTDVATRSGNGSRNVRTADAKFAIRAVRRIRGIINTMIRAVPALGLGDRVEVFSFGLAGE
ncbi:MAG: hypothetical protein QE274_16365 [Verrucomicrobiaceae bacterium]|nr:hypothetical protein [Verrucomicrobiaceae bacterium]